MEHQLTHIKNCPVCGSESHSKYLDAIDHNVSGDTFTIVECNQCKFKFTSPIPTIETIGEYYKSENYISHSGTKKGIINSIYHIVRNKAIKEKCQLAAKHSRSKNILDIGCGTGEFLNYCKSNGWSAKGLEPSDSARQFAKENYSLDVSPLEDLKNLPDNSRDIISMWHVLEHVYNLNNDITEFKRILTADGALLVAVPNCSSKDAQIYGKNWAAYDLPIHLYHFTPSDIKNLFKNHGFDVAEILPMKFDSYYVSMLSEKYKNGNIISGFLNGLRSNLAANNKNNQYSSQIYVLKPNKAI